MLGIIGAMDEEVAQIKEKMTDVTVTSVAGMGFLSGQTGRKGRSCGSLWYRQGKCRVCAVRFWRIGSISVRL